MKQLFRVPLIERYRLNKSGSDKETYHLVLDLSETDITYEVGDCLAIIPPNSPEAIQALLDTHGAGGHEKVLDRHGNEHVLHNFLLEHVNLDRLPEAACIEELCQKARPILPRFYSIASSMSAVGKQAHLTVQCVGKCSQFLCFDVPLGTPLTLYHHPARDFKLTHDQPIIMVGPGTGVAPFRGFMQERVAKNHPHNWLFFGERRKATDFYYEEYWTTLQASGHLRLDVAFSRDSAEKTYVQHKMLEQSAQLWDWIHNKHAYLYVCGDAKRMAKDVDSALHQIAQQQGNLSEAEAKAYFKTLKQQQRYLRDVY